MFKWCIHFKNFMCGIAQQRVGDVIIIEVPNREKTSFRPSKWPRKFKNRKIVKISKLPKNCFEPVGQGGWPSRSSWINFMHKKKTNN
jgi:hypothetical protein